MFLKCQHVQKDELAAKAYSLWDVLSVWRCKQKNVNKLGHDAIQICTVRNEWPENPRKTFNHIFATSTAIFAN